MKKIILQFSFLIVTFFTINSFVGQQGIALTQGAEITFDKSTHDYGQIEKSANGECVFVFTNTGNQPLKITNAKGSCGCTVPSWRKKDGSSTWAPGESGEMLVKFNGSGKNQVSKTITITANTEAGKETLMIKAFVNPKEGAAAVPGVSK